MTVATGDMSAYPARRRALLGALTGTVLEIGAGAGANFADFRSDIKWPGLEPDLGRGRKLAANAASYGHRAPVITAPAERIPLGEASVDAVAATGQARQKVRALSGGQKRRLDLALGMIGNPAVLFLDEPTTGFDPNARRDAWQIVRGLRDAGTTILLTTHYMEEAQVLADRVAVISGGQIVAEGTPSTIGGRDTARARIRFALPAGYAVADLPVEAACSEGLVTVETADPTQSLHELTGWAMQRRIVLAGLAVDQPSLEDIYLRLTGHAGPESILERSTR